MTKAEKQYGISIGIETVTPEMASRWLADRAKNRKIRDKVVARYAADMRAGKWKLTHQGLAFNSEGKLIDGQQRLTAIVESGTALPFIIVRGIDDILAIDTHRARFMSDIIGLQSSMHVTIKTTAIANAMVEYTRVTPAWPQNMSAATLAEFIQAHEQGISFAEHTFKVVPKLCSAALMAPVARAFYHTDPERLRQFVHVLQTGEPGVTAEDLAAIKLRNLLVNLNGGGDRGERINKYRKTEHAINLFMERKGGTLRIIDELYPLPTETEHYSQVVSARETTPVEPIAGTISVTESVHEVDEEEMREDQREVVRI